MFSSTRNATETPAESSDESLMATAGSSPSTEGTGSLSQQSRARGNVTFNQGVERAEMVMQCQGPTFFFMEPGSYNVRTSFFPENAVVGSGGKVYEFGSPAVDVAAPGADQFRAARQVELERSFMSTNTPSDNFRVLRRIAGEASAPPPILPFGGHGHLRARATGSGIPFPSNFRQHGPAHNKVEAEGSKYHNKCVQDKKY